MTDYVLEISCDPAREEEVLARLFLTTSTGSVSADGVITAYFDSAPERDAAARLFREFDVLAEDRARVDWLDRYQQSLEPLFIGKSFVVTPDEKLLHAQTGVPVLHSIVVPQEQAFGTGSHETTSLCIEMLESMELRGKRGLDIGSGTGILAMAMLLLGCQRAIAFDNDPDAYGPLRDNRMRNRIDERSMPLFIGSVEALRGGIFDVITMNIVPEVIIPMLPQVVPHMRGDLIVSGILNERRDDVVRAAAPLKLVAGNSKGEWWCGRFNGA